MAENKHTLQDLKLYQALPLEIKLEMSKTRIRGWVREFGENGVYVSFSGGKDSTVLLDIVHKEFPNVPAVFADVPTQFPELKTFAIEFCKNNGITLEIVKPKISFMQVCEKYGFPLLGKEISSTVYYSKKYVEKNGLTSGDVPDDAPARFKILMGKFPHKERGVLTNEMSKMYNKSRYKFMVDAPFEIGSGCCNVMKKKPMHDYSKKTGRVPIIGIMASESALRTQRWIKEGCNSFDNKEPNSKPLSFWTDQDILQYIKQNNLPICSVYGEVKEDIAEDDYSVDGQMTISDLDGWGDSKEYDAKKPKLKTTGCQRTGCVLCGFGCQLERQENARFPMLRESHPQLYSLLDIVKNNGVTYREAIEWINEHGNMNIKM